MASVRDITFGDLLVFMGWMQKMEQACEHQLAVPDPPRVMSAKVKGWMYLMQTLEERRRQGDERLAVLEATLAAHEARLGPLFSSLLGNLAVLYETLGRGEKAQAVRQRLEAIHDGPSKSRTTPT